MNNKTILAIDIGSTKVCAAIATVNEIGVVHITGTGIVKAQGLKKGTITNIDLASKSIKNALNDAKRVAGTSVNKAVVSISGAYTKSLNSSGIVNVPNKEIGTKEIHRAMQTSLYNANIPSEYDVVQALPYNFKVDDQDFIEDPLGMNATRLEVETHVVTSQKSNLNNLKKAIKASGIEVENIVLSSYASAIATLKEEEKEIGVALIDLGGNTSNLVIHSGNSIRYTDFLGVGSNHITNDLSMALHTPLSVAEKIKVDYGTLNSVSNNDLIEIPLIGDENATHEISLDVVHNVIYARVEETLMILAQSIQKSGLKNEIGAGIVLTGGLTKLDGIRELSVAIFDNKPVRVAKPNDVDGLFESLKDPVFSTVIGLILYSAGSYSPYEIDSNKSMRHMNEKHGGNKTSLDDLMKEKSNEDESNKSEDDDKQPGFMELGANKSKDESSVNKVWNYITQLF